MECVHLDANVMITADTVPQDTRSRCCSVCRTERNPWMCLTCGKINCGRYVGGHAKDHCDELKSQHCVSIDVDSCFVYCYTCDEFVINDTISGHLESIRKHLQELNANNIKSYDDESISSERNQTKENRRVRRHHSSSLSNSRDRKRVKKEDSVIGTRPKTLGLLNLGNTCFMNAVLQSLSNIQSFCGYIKQLPSLETGAVKKKPQTRRDKDTDDLFLIEELRKTLVALWEGGKTAISPESLFQVIWKVVPRFRGYQQQDAHEFMRYLLDRLHTELLTLLSYPNNSSAFIGPRGRMTIVNSIFGGILQSEVNCLVCGMESKKHDPFLDLSLDIPTDFTAKTPNPKNGETICKLVDCLSSFTDVEELEDTELYMCANCKTRQRSTKKFWLRQLPNVLCLHLKRFRWSSYYRVKVDTYVQFPLKGLDMSLYLLNNLHETRNSCGMSNEYDLAAVIVHHGTGAGSGHYTSYATHEGEWYHFNDSLVSPCTEETVLSCRAYMLFYVRRNIKLPTFLNKSPPTSTSVATSTRASACKS